MGERLDRHCFEGVVGGDVLEDLGWLKRRPVLRGNLTSGGYWESSSRRVYLVVTKEPDRRGLIVLVVSDHNVVSSDLQEVALRSVRFTI